MHKLSHHSQSARGSAGRQRGAVCAPIALFALTLLFNGAGCIWLDDFGKFKIGDAGQPPDAGRPDAAADASADSAASERCKDVDCSDMDKGCVKGVCDPASGECKPQDLEDGAACFDGNPCTTGDTCNGGTCGGELLNCSALDDDCSQGMCDPETGGCTFGPTQMSRTCNDADACTINDRCTGDPAALCVGETAPEGTRCDDFYSCTGTEEEPDTCDDKGECQGGAPLAEGTLCFDDNECTADDKCDAEGTCIGEPTKEGEPCWEGCASNTTCRQGACKPDEDEARKYNPRCLANFCGISNVCQERWKTDQVCHCGCGYQDPACSACSPYMCQTLGDHKAARWCDGEGQPSANCPENLKNDGKCDCGCQFDDPDCNGGACCAGTGAKGCNDSYIEACVCDNLANGDATCCTGEWTDRCADLAVNLGCMLCPREQ